MLEITVADFYDLNARRRFPRVGRVRAATVLVQRPTLGELVQIRFQIAVRRQHVVTGLVVQGPQQASRLSEVPSCFRYKRKQKLQNREKTIHDTRN